MIDPREPGEDRGFDEPETVRRAGMDYVSIPVGHKDVDDETFELLWDSHGRLRMPSNARTLRERQQGRGVTHPLAHPARKEEREKRTGGGLSGRLAKRRAKMGGALVCGETGYPQQHLSETPMPVKELKTTLLVVR